MTRLVASLRRRATAAKTADYAAHPLTVRTYVRIDGSLHLVAVRTLDPTPTTPTQD